MINVAINDILQKIDLEKYIFSNNLVIAYYATAFAGHGLLYELLRIGTTEQKINIIEHGSSKHVKILTDDFNPVVKKRAIEKLKLLKEYPYHEYVSSEKIEILQQDTDPRSLLFYDYEINPVVAKVFKEREDSSFNLEHCIIDCALLSKITSQIELTQEEIEENLSVDIEAKILEAKKLLERYKITYEITNCYQLGVYKIFKEEKPLFTFVGNYFFYYKDNPLVPIYIYREFSKWSKESLDIYEDDISSELEDYDKRKLILEETNLSEKILLKIIEDCNSFEEIT